MAKLRFFGNEEEDEDAGKAVEAKFKTLEDSNKETKETLTSLAETIKAMNERSTREETERIALRKKEQEAEDKKNQRVAPTAEEEFERFANDPMAFVREAASPAARVALITAAKQTKIEVLGEKEYYSGEIKTSVDAMIEAEQNLALRANPNFILNCYKIVVADNMDKIHKGEIKTRAAMHSFSDGGNGGGRKADDGKVEVDWGQNSKAKYAAAQLGLSEEDIIGAAKDRAIHGLEVVA
jgi:hypothetical protein